MGLHDNEEKREEIRQDLAEGRRLAALGLHTEPEGRWVVCPCGRRSWVLPIGFACARSCFSCRTFVRFDADGRVKSACCLVCGKSKLRACTDRHFCAERNPVQDAALALIWTLEGSLPTQRLLPAARASR